MSVLQRIQQCVRERRYYLSTHAEEEMWADRLERADVEYCLLKGYLDKRLTHDARGTRYRVAGPTQDSRRMCVVCRFHPVEDLLIITVYALEGDL